MVHVSVWLKHKVKWEVCLATDLVHGPTNPIERDYSPFKLGLRKTEKQLSDGEQHAPCCSVFFQATLSNPKKRSGIVEVLPIAQLFFRHSHALKGQHKTA